MADFLKAVFAFLNTNADYAVLRNYDGLPEFNNSRDIDIIIEKDIYANVKSQLIDVVEQCGWKIVTLLKSDRLVTWVCGNIAMDGSVNLIQLDFFFNTSVFGIELLPARYLLKSKSFNGKIYHVDIVCEFLDKYLYDRAVGAKYPEKYNAVKTSVKTNSDVISVLKKVFGVNSIEECDGANGKKLLLHAFCSSPFLNFVRFIRFEYYRIANYLKSNTGFTIGFTGPDGVGKTTVINKLIDSLGVVFRDAHEYMHFRPTLFGNLGDVAHSAGLKKDVDRNYSDPHRGGKTGKVSSFLRLFYYSLDYIVGYWIKIKSVTRITRLVIFDRYYTDIICDSRRSRIYLSPKFLYRYGRVFIPSLDYNILLTADTDVILARKQELSIADVEAINKNIDFLASKKGYLKVLNNSSPEATVTSILTYIFENQHNINLNRLK
ncbi:MAG: hypothetical protein SPH95_08660 [Candidatus Aphodosoma sp.]|nr:hypothetical protein [Candidatus Aphodosoma sp.]